MLRGVFILKTAVERAGERQGVVIVSLQSAPHLTKMVKSSMFTTHSGLKNLAILTALQLPFLGSFT
jgi:hypothetical protein